MTTPHPKTYRYVNDIMSEWGITDPWAILPTNLAPRSTYADGSRMTFAGVSGNDNATTTHPHFWAKSFAEELRRLSGFTRGRHTDVVEFLSSSVSRRQVVAGIYAVAEITAADVRGVLAELKLAEAAVNDVRREAKDNGTFVGGLAEVLHVLGAAREEEMEMEGENGGGVALPVGERKRWPAVMSLPVLDSTRQRSTQAADDAAYYEREL